MSDAPIKTYFMTGNLNTDEYLSTAICEQSTNISIGLWNICIDSVCVDIKDQNGFFCSISCNLVKDKKFNTIINPRIATVFLKGRKIIYLDKTWFTINNLCSEIKLFFTNIETQKILSINCDLHVNLLLQRVK
jgi:hypothetical protein